MLKENNCQQKFYTQWKYSSKNEDILEKQKLRGFFTGLHTKGNIKKNYLEIKCEDMRKNEVTKGNDFVGKLARHFDL